MRATARSDTRRKIVLAARKRFRRYGITKTTMLEIARDVDLAVGTLYLYFKDKNDLIVGCADEFGRKHRVFASALLKSSLSPPDKLRRYMINRFRAVEETRVASTHAAQIARAVIRLKPERFEEDDRWLYQNILAILREGIAEGVFHIMDPERDTAVFLQCMFNFLPVAGMEPFRPPTEANLVKVVDWFIETWS